jgi:argininosuccinate lyase
MWSGRFREPLDAEFEAWQRSIVFDWRLLDQEIAASKAHASALCAPGILTEAETAELRAALWMRLPSEHAIGSRQSAGARSRDRRGHSSLRRAEAGGAHRLAGPQAAHRAAAATSRSPPICAFMCARKSNSSSTGSPHGPTRSSSRRVKPGRRRNAELHAYAARRARAGGSLAAGLRRNGPARRRVARLRRAAQLTARWARARGWRNARRSTARSPRASWIHAPTANSMDATSDRDFILEYLQALTFVGLHLSRFAEEITLFATAEFNL